MSVRTLFAGGEKDELGSCPIKKGGLLTEVCH